MVRIAICEDNPDHADILRKMIHRWASVEEKQVEVHCYRSAEEFLFYWPGKTNYSLAFLDIQMASISGLQLARTIRRQNKTILLVFTTGLKDYILKGYEVKAYRFLLKPLKEKEVFATLHDAADEIALLHSEAIVLPTENGLKRVYKKDIYYVEIDDHYLVIHTIQENIRYKMRLKDIECHFPEPQFCKCHRSYIVNLYHTGRLTRDKVEIDNGDALPVSRARWTAFNECFIGYYMYGKKDEHADF